MSISLYFCLVYLKKHRGQCQHEQRNNFHIDKKYSLDDNRQDWILDPGDYTHKKFGFRPCVGYYLNPHKKKKYNPLILLGIGANLEFYENQTLQLKDSGIDWQFSLSLSNQFVVFKYFGLTVGYELLKDGTQEFNEYGELYVVRYEMEDYPIASIDFIIPFSKKKD